MCIRDRVVASIAKASHRTLVFSRTKHGADRLVRSVNDLGVAAAAIHGDLRQKARERALADFASGDGRTSLCAMGSSRNVLLGTVAAL